MSDQPWSLRDAPPAPSNPAGGYERSSASSARVSEPRQVNQPTSAERSGGPDRQAVNNGSHDAGQSRTPPPGAPTHRSPDVNHHARTERAGTAHHHEHTSIHSDPRTEQSANSLVTDPRLPQLQAEQQALRAEIADIDTRLNRPLNYPERADDQARRDELIGNLQNDDKWQKANPRSNPEPAERQILRSDGFTETGVHIRLHDQDGHPLHDYRVTVTFVNETDGQTNTIDTMSDHRSGSISLERDVTLVPRGGTIVIQAEPTDLSGSTVRAVGTASFVRDSPQLMFDATTTSYAVAEQRQRSGSATDQQSDQTQITTGLQIPTPRGTVSFGVQGQHQDLHGDTAGWQEGTTATRTLSGDGLQIKQQP